MMGSRGDRGGVIPVCSFSFIVVVLRRKFCSRVFWLLPRWS
jgi:hypothetical protein